MRTIAEGLQFPEGPVAMPDGSVIFVEMARGTLSRAWGAGKVEVVADLGGSPNGAAMGPGGKIYVCNSGGVNFDRKDGRLRPLGNHLDLSRIEVVDPQTGTFERLYDHCGDLPLRALNDLVFDDHGGFYCTERGKTLARSIDRGSVFYAKADGSEIREVAYPLLSPNGVGLSPDGRTLYVSETLTARLWAWEVLAPGKLRKVRAEGLPHGGRLLAGFADYCRLDSLAVSASGKVLVATLTHGGVTEVWPDGSFLRHHPLPDTNVNNIAFGGKDLRTAYVTMSGAGVLVSMDWHEPGLRLPYQELPA